MTETTTEDAGRHPTARDLRGLMKGTIRRDECDDERREARNALRAELKAGVAALPEWRVAEPGQVERAAVLDLIGEDES